MTDHALRDAERRFAAGEIGREHIQAIRRRHGVCGTCAGEGRHPLMMMMMPSPLGDRVGYVRSDLWEEVVRGISEMEMVVGSVIGGPYPAVMTIDGIVIQRAGTFLSDVMSAGCSECGKKASQNKEAANDDSDSKSGNPREQRREADRPEVEGQGGS